MLTMKSRYALKALLVLAERGFRQRVLTAEIAERDGIPRRFLLAILRELKQHGILTSYRGRGGGYSLGQRPEDVTIAVILRALDGAFAADPWSSCTPERGCEECDGGFCCVRAVIERLQRATDDVVEGTTLADLLQMAREAQTNASQAGSLELIGERRWHPN